MSRAPSDREDAERESAGTGRAERGLGVATFGLFVLTLLIGGVFFVRFEPALILPQRLLQPIAAALLVVSASLATGRVVLRLGESLIARAGTFENATTTNDEPEVDSTAILGIPALGLLIALLSLAGSAQPLVLALVTVILAAIGLGTSWKPLVDLLRCVRPGILALYAIPLAIAAIGAMAPVNTPDELTYKLAIPRTYQLFERMLELPLNSASYFPAAVYMADLPAMVLGGASAARFLHFILYVCTLRILFRISRELVSTSSPRGEIDRAHWPVIVVAWTPALMIIAGWAWAEWPMLGLLLLSIHAWQRFVEGRSARELAIATAALALALSTKYTALPWLVAFAPVAVIDARSMRLRARVIGAAAILIALFGGFYYVRNAIWTGSPIAPFLLPHSPAIENYRSSLGGWAELTRGYDIFHPGIVDDSLGVLLPVMVLFAPFALLFGARRGYVVRLLTVGGLQLVLLITLAPTSRLILTAAVPMALVGAALSVRLWTAWGRGVRFAAAAAALAALAGQLLLVCFSLVTSWNFGAYLAGAESEMDYLRRTREYVPVYQWLETNTREDATILLLGENRPFHLARRALSAANLDGARVSAWLSRFSTPDALHTEMERLRISYVVVHRQRYRIAASDPGETRSMIAKEFILEVPPAVHAALSGFFRQYGEEVYRDESYLVFRLSKKRSSISLAEPLLALGRLE
ncbi:MAG TPA: hypothetical protein VMT00_15630 [Thermoanaerobaculia bacterium]|nr:hypothetical protein [Thermoanaerobaculia bacterium]